MEGPGVQEKSSSDVGGLKNALHVFKDLIKRPRRGKPQVPRNCKEGGSSQFEKGPGDNAGQALGAKKGGKMPI